MIEWFVFRLLWKIYDLETVNAIHNFFNIFRQSNEVMSISVKKSIPLSQQTPMRSRLVTLLSVPLDETR